MTFAATGTAGALASIQVTTPDTTPSYKSAFTVTAQLLDAYGNNVTTSGTPVTFTMSGAQSSSFTFQTTATPTTNGNGAVTVSVKASSRNLSCTITATVNPISGSLGIGQTTN